MNFKNFISLFVVQEEGQNKEEGKQQEQTPNTSDNQSSVPPAVPQDNSSTMPPPIPQEGNIDQRILESLQKALESSNTEGYDYLEFKHALQSLVNIIPDEAMRFKSAFATVAPMGVTAQKILESVSYYRNILLKEKEKFNQALSTQIDQGVGVKQKRMEELSTIMQQNSETIQRLMQENVAYEEEINQIKSHINEVVAKIENTKNNFDYTLQNIVSQINTDEANIQKHLA
ncbi:MAG: hypothetical protein MUE81_05970 [Thermoflexibacter sp.]|nr:hypothetical protein [Thermoflexibacter sp.]